MAALSYKTVLVAALAVSVITGSAWLRIAGHAPDGGALAGRTGTALVGGPFNLVSHRGERATEAILKGQLTLIYFGYTFCPDICPMELQTMGAALDMAGGKDGAGLGGIQALFITIDPERDTQAALAAYMKNFHPRMLGLTGSKDEIAAAAKAFRVYFAKAENAQEPENYLMDHSNIIYLMGREGEFLTHFGFGAPPEEIAAKLKEYR